jgi:1-aminocyclopropane-1-carboxylate deaminase
MRFLEEIHDRLFETKELKVYVLRLDKIHPITGGNKHFKLKYNLSKAKELDSPAVLSFGGAYSNHIAALAAAAKEAGLRSIGVIRGDELNAASNNTLKRAEADGMRFYFASRESYSNKTSEGFLDLLKKEFGDFFLIPEGGSNAHAVKGTKEITQLIDIPFDHVLTACGTGGTIAGISLSLADHQETIGIPVLKGAQFLEKDIELLQEEYAASYHEKISGKRPRLFYDYHFGGYAKSDPVLEQFRYDFEKSTGISLDSIYTAKAFYALYDLTRKDIFPWGKTIVIIHTGGLQVAK